MMGEGHPGGRMPWEGLCKQQTSLEPSNAKACSLHVLCVGWAGWMPRRALLLPFLPHDVRVVTGERHPGDEMHWEGLHWSQTSYDGLEGRACPCHQLAMVVRLCRPNDCLPELAGAAVYGQEG